MAVDVLSRQAIVLGSVTDSIAGTRPRSLATLRVVDAADGRTVPGVLVRMGADGLFVASGDPATVLAPQDITLRLEFRAAGYQPLDRLEAFLAADLARAQDQIAHGGGTVPATVISGLPRAVEVQMTPEPVTLKGRVSRADTGAAIAGAQVAISAPAAVGPVATDAQGYFTLGPAPVAESVTIDITAAGFDALTRSVRLDFRQPVNTGAYALEES